MDWLLKRLPRSQAELCSGCLHGTKECDHRYPDVSFVGQMNGVHMLQLCSIGAWELEQAQIDSVTFSSLLQA